MLAKFCFSCFFFSSKGCWFLFNLFGWVGREEGGKKGRKKGRKEGRGEEVDKKERKKRERKKRKIAQPWQKKVTLFLRPSLCSCVGVFACSSVRPCQVNSANSLTPFLHLVPCWPWLPLGCVSSLRHYPVSLTIVFFFFFFNSTKKRGQYALLFFLFLSSFFLVPVCKNIFFMGKKITLSCLDFFFYYFILFLGGLIKIFVAFRQHCFSINIYNASVWNLSSQSCFGGNEGLSDSLKDMYKCLSKGWFLCVIFSFTNWILWYLLKIYYLILFYSCVWLVSSRELLFYFFYDILKAVTRKHLWFSTKWLPFYFFESCLMLF